jgi:hypothetical protein
MLNSKAFEFNKNDFLSLAKNALMVGLAAILTYVGQNLSHIDLGAGTALVVPVVTIMIDSAVKWVRDNTK